MFTTGNATVDAVGQLHLEGNTIPHTWYKNLTLPNGKPDLNSIIILAEIIYWHRPTYVKDEATGQLVTVKKKFHADLLQRSYDSFAEQFNLSKKQVKEAFDRLEKIGVVKREFRQVGTGASTLYNVLFIHLDVGLLGGITFKVGRVVPQTSTPSNPRSREGGALEVGTNTEITTDITTNINNDDNKTHASGEKLQKSNGPNAFRFYEQNGFGFISHHVAQKIEAWINDLSEELVIHAMERAVENNVYTWKYVEAILKDWDKKRFKSIVDIQADDKRREAAKKNNSQRHQPRGREERVPEWFHTRNEDTPKQTASHVEQTGQAMDFEAERKKILDMLGKTEK